ncbi:MAG: class I SAM-dependent methyltransferase [Proteobacteria bacterium]|nr:class I SAM-dependent methyltransferase [Pseudomonadota bacterium]
MQSWIEFYNSAHSIYVNARHKDAHYRDVAHAITALVPNARARVLDFGCGEALHADLVAAAAAQVLLCDAAPNVRAAIAARFGADARIRVLSPREVECLPDGALDLIVANSFVQYLTTVELDAHLVLWRRLLAPTGRLVVADVIPPEVGTLSDVRALLRYAARGGFLVAACLGLARTALSPYRRLRATLTIAKYREVEFLRALRRAGLAGERLAHNLEHNPARMTFSARPSTAR